ncbi:MAG: hypothetical protein KH943_06440 [Haemophilus parahaemolyticus]|uniref:hypothetical protein n=1 Tax=Haemophilus parahaemolyticus TaxID=735 RepID=UPI0026EB0788|nr:hypothetical protein [Haemophilus parahaemolyticus]MBS6009401.1 hypothetical protein [Haemophilus parahaemolyticus]
MIMNTVAIMLIMSPISNQTNTVKVITEIVAIKQETKTKLLSEKGFANLWLANLRS